MKPQEALQSIVDEFEMDYMLDGEVVDNPSSTIRCWYEYAKIALEQLSENDIVKACDDLPSKHESNAEQIRSVIGRLCQHEISKSEAESQLMVVFGTAQLGGEQKEALDAAVSAIYFNDNSDYLRALHIVARKLSGVNDLFLNRSNIDKLFRQLNPED
ncbi:hypothetical protein KC921_02770 [Candidatus Woesebacteria bacterium]|nr:hypothetical protein [Candidatus Woesebacteria bacterium]